MRWSAWMKVIGVINLIGIPMFDEWINKTLERH
jgi:hypothetical protein